MDDHTYSRIIGWLKVVLPILALGLLSTLFLVARTVDPAQQLPFADVDVEGIARDERVGSPDYSSVTTEGAAIAVAARIAVPDADDPSKVTGQEIQAEIDLPSGEHIDIVAGRMRLNPISGVATLSEDVVISSSLGYAIESSGIEVALDHTGVKSTGPARLSGDIGELTANQFELITQSGTKDGHLLLFNGDVRLIFTPGR